MSRLATDQGRDGVIDVPVLKFVLSRTRPPPEAMNSPLAASTDDCFNPGARRQFHRSPNVPRGINFGHLRYCCYQRGQLRHFYRRDLEAAAQAAAVISRSKHGWPRVATRLAAEPAVRSFPPPRRYQNVVAVKALPKEYLDGFRVGQPGALDDEFLLSCHDGMPSASP